MTDSSDPRPGLPPEQRAIRARCFHSAGTFVEFPKTDIDTSVSGRFEKVAAMYPDRVAVRIANEPMTYDELNTAANRLAHAILAERPDRQEPVAIFLERSAVLSVATLAVLKAGKIALHLEPNAPRDRNTHILVESGARLMLSNAVHASTARQWASHNRLLFNIDELRSALGVDNLKVAISSGDYAYIGLTSGVTGKIKCAMKTHGYLLHSVMDETNSCHICPDDRLVILGFNAISKFPFMALLNGAAYYSLDRRDDELLRLHR